jgi:positive regulator of sigma E activity
LKGILLGYSYENENRVIVTFSAKHGAQIWQYHASKCGNCQSLKACREVILGEAEERGITLTKEEKKSTPTQLAHTVFSKVIPGLEP